VISEIVRLSTEHFPIVIERAGIDALVLDSSQYYLGILPMHLQMPYVHVSPALPLDLSGLTPPRAFNWPHDTSPAGLARNRAGVEQVKSMMEPCTRVARSYAGRVGLTIDWDEPDATISKLAWIAQIPREFDFPGDLWPKQFRYAGPFQDAAGRAEKPFPWELIMGEPLIYASMGTLQNGLESVFQTIVGAAEEITGFQLVLSIGSNLKPDQFKRKLGKTVLVDYAPQLELLKRSSLCVTHAGMNTTLEALSHGVPMVAIPVTNDQPGVAARITHHHAGKAVLLDELTPATLHAAMREVLNDGAYRKRAQQFRDITAHSDGLNVASEIIEQSFGLGLSGH
jgi:zeaxanthin glucosyltransferase